MTKLDCCDGSVEVILDKGSLDALMCTWSSQESCDLVVSEAQRVLVSHGVYIIFTGQSRTSNFLAGQTAQWKVKISSLPSTAIGRKPLTVIVMRKRLPSGAT